MTFSSRTRIVLSLFFATFSATPAFAQRMEVTAKDAQPVVVQSADITTEIAGRIALTTIDLVFKNPNDRILEGSFAFPLLEGQSVVGFALDIDDHLREAVPVEKARARAVFESIQRRQVDPALLEQTEGNNYRVRVYPLPAGGTRRVAITYQELLPQTSGQPGYRLVLNYPDLLKKFSLTLNMSSGSDAPATIKTTLDLPSTTWEHGRKMQIERTDFSAKGILELTLPKTKHPPAITARHQGIEYFCAEIPVETTAQPRPLPDVVGILWDASGSGRRRDHAREFQFLDEWFKHVVNVKVHLVLLRDRASEPLVYDVTNGNWSALRQALETTAYDGATSLDGLTDLPRADEWLLFSDGLFNYGTTRPYDLLPVNKSPLHTILASTSADFHLLENMADRHQGEYVNLLENPPEAAAISVRSKTPRVLRIECSEGDVTDLHPAIGSPVKSGSVLVSGILRSPRAKVAITTGHGRSKSHKAIVEIASGENTGRLAARAWAAARIKQLAADPVENKEALHQLSTTFGIVTPGTSLIVLETVEDYLRYNITPPDELKEAWEALQKEKRTETETDRHDHLESVAENFQQKIEWWDKTYPKELPPKSTPSPTTNDVAPPPLSRPSGWSSDYSSVFTPQTPPPSRPSWPTQPSPGKTILNGRVLNPANGRYLASSVVNVTGDTINETAYTDELGFFQFTDLPPAPVTLSAGYSGLNTWSQSLTLVIDEVTSIDIPLTSDSDESEMLVLTPFSVSSDRERYASAMTQQRMTSSFSDQSYSASTSGRRRGSDSNEDDQEDGEIALRAWEPQSGYIDRLKKSRRSAAYDVYLAERPAHEKEPGFYLDVADHFFKHGDSATALRVLSNLAELQLEDVSLLRTLGHRLVQARRSDLAVPIFEKVLYAHSDEPQSHRDLGLACAEARQFQRAVDLLWEVISRPWDDRFEGIELIALGELNAIVATCGKRLDLSKIDPRLLKNTPVGLRIILTWDANDSDMDLWVRDPLGEDAGYSHPETKQGGVVSDDFTEGYGPEEFLLRAPAPGIYRIKIHYYGEHRQTLFGPVTAQVRVITGFGTSKQKEKRITVRLENVDGEIEIGSVEITKSGRIKK